MDADATKDLSQIGQEGPDVPSSPDREEDKLFQTFDRPAFKDTESSDKSSHLASTHDLTRLITDIPQVIDRFNMMKTSFESDDEVATSSKYSNHPDPPELVQGEADISGSDHSGSILLEQPEEDQWTYPRGIGRAHV